MDKYIIRELIPPFFGALSVIMFVLVLDFLLDILNLIIAKGVEVFIVGKLFVYNLAWILTLSVPMASLMTSLMTYGRLSEDRETTALKALGIPFWRLVVPGAVLMSILSIGMIIFGDKVVPEANYMAKKLIYQIHRVKPMAALKERIFIEDFPNIVLYIDRLDEDAEKIYGVTIYEKQKGEKPRTIIAPEGEVHYDQQADAVNFILYNGTIHDIDPQDPTKYTLAEFNKQVIQINDLGTRLDETHGKRRGDRELSIKMIKDKIIQQKKIISDSRQSIRETVSDAIDSLFQTRDYGARPHSSPIRRALILSRRQYMTIRRMKFRIESADHRIRMLSVEYHKKFALPLACLLFLLVGAPVGVWAKKGGLGVAVGLSFGFFLIYWAFLIGGEELADRGVISPIIGMWSGNIVLLIIFFIMLYRVTFEARFSGFGWIAKITKKIWQKSGNKIDNSSH